VWDELELTEGSADRAADGDSGTHARQAAIRPRHRLSPRSSPAASCSRALPPPGALLAESVASIRLGAFMGRTARVASSTRYPGCFPPIGFVGRLINSGRPRKP
jgi:hypothetical protein